MITMTSVPPPLFLHPISIESCVTSLYLCQDGLRYGNLRFIVLHLITKRSKIVLFIFKVLNNYILFNFLNLVFILQLFDLTIGPQQRRPQYCFQFASYLQRSSRYYPIAQLHWQHELQQFCTHPCASPFLFQSLSSFSEVLYTVF